jgi:Flp pilus assembly pilin Flp
MKMNKIKSFLKDESGMETLEYAVIAGLIAAVAVFVYASNATAGWGSTLKARLTAATTTS